MRIEEVDIHKTKSRVSNSVVMPHVLILTKYLREKAQGQWLFMDKV
jgi:hypothetical protein